MTKVLLIGCGKMGEAMLSGWLAQGLAPSDIVVVEPGQAARDKLRAQGIAAFAAAAELPTNTDPDLVVIAIKPQMTDQTMPAYRRFARRACFLSIAAGKTLAVFAQLLGDEAAVVRAMPNTPAAVGRGISAAYANPRVSAVQRDLCTRALESVGSVCWLDDEGLIDAVTGVSGSGPAYVFHLIEALAAGGQAAGLPADLAMQLARATVCGAGELAYQSTESAEQLRRNVTSPNGTTQAGLEILMAPGGLTDLMTRTVAAATRRSRELAQG